VTDRRLSSPTLFAAGRASGGSCPTARRPVAVLVVVLRAVLDRTSPIVGRVDRVEPELVDLRRVLRRDCVVDLVGLPTADSPFVVVAVSVNDVIAALGHPPDRHADDAAH
jgi:hypothetical protein